MLDSEFNELSAIAGGSDELAALARGVLAELRRRAPRILTDGEATMDIFHAAWERFTVRFDRTRGIAPTTYMHWCIRYALRRHFQRGARYAPYCVSELFGDADRGDALAELALDRNGAVCVQSHANNNGSDVENSAEQNELRGYLESALAYLDPRTARCVRRRYFENMTLREIGEKEGLSHERIRQLVNAGLERLRYRYIQRDDEEVGECEPSDTFIPGARSAVEKAVLS